LYLEANAGAKERTLERASERGLLAVSPPEFVAEECKVPADTVAKLADEIARAGTQFSDHLWRNASSGNLGGWQVARALMLLHALTGSLGVPGGVNPNTRDKFVPKPSGRGSELETMESFGNGWRWAPRRASPMA
jgi:anaerobic selenocysteine-containing dehydrogenase